MHGSPGRLHAAHAFPPLAVLLYSLATPVLAQEPPPELPRVEVWGAVAGDAETLDGTMASAYAPPLIAGTAITSRASQVLVVDPGRATGVEVGVNVFVTRRVGVQGLVGVATADVSGRNGPYDVFLRYETRQPPDYVPREFEVSHSTPWPDTSGSLRTTSVAVGLVARWWTARRDGGGTVSGGLGFERAGGDVASLGYTSFRLGGHGVLFSSDHRIVMTPEGGGTFIRPYVRADVHRRVAPHVALMASARVHLATTQDLPVRVDRLVDRDEAPIVPELADVERDLGRPSLVLRGTRWQVAAGLKFWF
ncbi:MAG: hypothetical protein KJ066_17080 [Acidobacteria bacterium]|nr:hypothetical protein [Acidobacteriota bacterium]